MKAGHGTSSRELSSCALVPRATWQERDASSGRQAAPTATPAAAGPSFMFPLFSKLAAAKGEAEAQNLIYSQKSDVWRKRWEDKYAGSKATRAALPPPPRASTSVGRLPNMEGVGRLAGRTAANRSSADMASVARAARAQQRPTADRWTLLRERLPEAVAIGIGNRMTFEV